METRALFPGGGFLLGLLLGGFMLVCSDLSFEMERSVEGHDMCWVRVARGEETGRFFQFAHGERLGDLVSREIPAFKTALSEVCRERALDVGVEVRLQGGDGSGEVSCSFSPLPERYRYLMGMPINLNRAGKEDLVLLPGIGGKLADRIVEVREDLRGFSSMDDLLIVRGIGTKLLEKIGRHASFGP